MFRCLPCNMEFRSQQALENHKKRYCSATATAGGASRASRLPVYSTTGPQSVPQQPTTTRLAPSTPPPPPIRPPANTTPDARGISSAETPNGHHQQQQQIPPLTTSRSASNAAESAWSASTPAVIVFDFVLGVPTHLLGSNRFQGWNGNVRMQYMLYTGDTPLGESSFIPNTDVSKVQRLAIVNAKREVSFARFRTNIKLIVQVLLLTYDMQNLLYAWTALEVVDRHGALVTGCFRLPLFIPPMNPILAVNEIDGCCTRVQERMGIPTELYVRIGDPTGSTPDILSQNITPDNCASFCFTPSYFKPPSLETRDVPLANFAPVSRATTAMSSVSARQAQASSNSGVAPAPPPDPQLEQLQQLLGDQVKTQQKEIEELKTLLKTALDKKESPPPPQPPQQPPMNPYMPYGYPPYPPPQQQQADVATQIALKMQEIELQNLKAELERAKAQAVAAPPPQPEPAKPVVPEVKPQVVAVAPPPPPLPERVIHAGRYAAQIMTCEAFDSVVRSSPSLKARASAESIVSVKVRLLLGRTASGYIDWTDWSEWSPEETCALEANLDWGQLEGSFKPICVSDQEEFSYMKVVVEFRVDGFLGAWCEFDAPESVPTGLSETMIRLRRPPVEVSSELVARKATTRLDGLLDCVLTFSFHRKAAGAAVPPAALTARKNVVAAKVAAVNALSPQKAPTPAPAKKAPKAVPKKAPLPPPPASKEPPPARTQEPPVNPTPKTKTEPPPKPEENPSPKSVPSSLTSPPKLDLEPETPAPKNEQEPEQAKPSGMGAVAQAKLLAAKARAKRDPNAFYQPGLISLGTLVPASIWKAVRLSHLPRPFTIPDGEHNLVLAVAVDAVRHVPPNVICTRVHVLLRSGSGVTTYSQSIGVQMLSTPTTYPEFDENAIAFAPLEAAASNDVAADITIECIDLISKKRKTLGHVQLSRVTMEFAQEIPVMVGPCEPIRVDTETGKVIEPSAEEAAQKARKIVRFPLTTVLMRAMAVPGDRKDLARRAPEATHLREASYAKDRFAYYDTVSCEPPKGGVFMHKANDASAMPRVPPTRLLSEEKINHIFEQDADPPKDLLDTSFCAAVDGATGVAFKVEAICGLRGDTSSVFKVVSELAPPSHYSLKKRELRGTFVSMYHDWESDINFPRFLDPPFVVPHVKYSPATVIVFHIYRCCQGVNKQKGPRPEPVAFGVVPVFRPPMYLRNGSFVVPLFMGPIPRQLLTELATTGDAGKIIKAWRMKKSYAIQPLERGGIYVSLYDTRRDPVIEVDRPKSGAPDGDLAMAPRWHVPVLDTYIPDFYFECGIEPSGIARHPRTGGTNKTGTALRKLCNGAKPSDVRQEINGAFLMEMCPHYDPPWPPKKTSTAHVIQNLDIGTREGESPQAEELEKQ
eukprot:PhM_4_TR9349/c0_g1_i1/m.17368